jgi:hypothetical protein
MSMTRSILVASATLLLSVGCGANADTPATASAAPEHADLAGAAVVPLEPPFESQNFASVPPNKDEIFAAMTAHAREGLLAACSTRVGPTSELFLRLVNLRNEVNPIDPDQGFPPDQKFELRVEADSAFCSTADITSSPVVTLGFVNAGGDPDRVGLTSDASLHRGQRIILSLAVGALADSLLVSPDVHGNGVVAVHPNLRVRFRDGGFTGAGTLPSLGDKKGAHVTLEGGLADQAVLVDLPPDAERLEVYLRFQRWKYAVEFFEDGTFTGFLTAPTSDGFISNGGHNYVLPVVAP